MTVRQCVNPVTVLSLDVPAKARGAAQPPAGAVGAVVVIPAVLGCEISVRLGAVKLLLKHLLTGRVAVRHPGDVKQILQCFGL